MAVRVAGGIFTLWLLNLACAHWLSYPFAYCWIWSGIWRYVLQPYASLALMVMAAYFIWALISSGLMSRKSMSAILLIGLIGGADGFAKALLTLPGNSCA